MAKATQAAVHDVFISYKRKTASAQARLIRADLANFGLRVFMDVTDLGSGFFDESLLNRIAGTRNFVLILAPEALDRCADENDWLRKELRQAFASGCNIVPIRLPGFEFPKNLPDDIRDLPRLQTIEYSHEFFEAMMNRLVGMLDLPIPLEQRKRVTEKDRGPLSPGEIRKTAAIGAVAAILIAAGIFTMQSVRSRSAQARILVLVAKVRQDFEHAVNAPETSRAPLLAAVQSDADAILRLDPRNGTGLYFQGEKKRLGTPALFTEKRCVIPSALKNQEGELDPFEDDFYRYLDLEGSMPASQTGGDTSGELCYTRASGFCPQRTAWVSHLLANDLYQEALLQTDPGARADKLNRALKLAQRASSLYHDQQNTPGFEQCGGTENMIHDIEARLTAPPH